MNGFAKRSRVTKALTDAAGAASFDEAEARLDAVRLDIVAGADQLATPAGQAAVLTAVATAKKCFGRVTMVVPDDTPLVVPLPIGATLCRAARRLGASIADRPRPKATRTIRVGTTPRPDGWSVRCWWDRWLSGGRLLDHDPIGDSRLPLGGVFAGALAVRHVFACVLAGRAVPARDTSVSLWTPWQTVDRIARGPERFDVPDKLWLLGLGHLGQAFVWNLCLLPGKADRLAVLQDDQSVSEENEATSLLVLPHGKEMKKRKTRLAASWLESSGWRTELIERRHHGDIQRTDEDPPLLLSGVDTLEPRLVLAKHGFPFMLDAGIGHGAGDFEGIQLRTIARGQELKGMWEAEDVRTAELNRDKLMSRDAYRDLEQKIGRCGTFELADASVAVPFVGAAAGALTIAQAIRLATLQATPRFLQIELGAPEMPGLGGMAAAPETNLGSFSLRL